MKNDTLASIHRCTIGYKLQSKLDHGALDCVDGPFDDPWN